MLQQASKQSETNLARLQGQVHCSVAHRIGAQKRVAVDSDDNVRDNVERAVLGGDMDCSVTQAVSQPKRLADEVTAAAVAQSSRAQCAPQAG